MIESEAQVIPLYLPYELLPWQAAVKRDRHRFEVIAAGRRSGKTVLGVDDLTTGAATVPGSVNWYVGPTYSAARDIAWDLFKRNFQDFHKYHLVNKVVESELLIRLRNGSNVQLKGGDKPDSLRGVRINRLVIDEFAVMKPEIWEEVLQPATSDTLAPVIINSTPKGYNHFYDLFKMQAQNPRDWRSWIIKTSEAGTIPMEEIERARRDMDPRVFRQEYEASFEAFGGQVFADFDLAKHVTAEPLKFVPEAEYALGMDFGWSAPSTVLFINVLPNEQVFVFGEYGRRETPIAQIGLAIKEKVPGRLSGLIACDPAGAAKSEALGMDPVTELRGLFGYETVKYRRNYPGIIQDGINLIRKWLRNKKILISPACVNLIQALQMYRYPDPKNDIQSELPLKDGISDHWIDPLRYFFLNRFPVRKSIVEAL